MSSSPTWISTIRNNYPWPEYHADKQRTAVETTAQTVLDVRTLHQTNGATLADLYDPVAMPPDLVKTHAALDRAVDLCYRPQPFTSERHRVEYLFSLYEKLTAPLTATAKPATIFTLWVKDELRKCFEPLLTLYDPVASSKGLLGFPCGKMRGAADQPETAPGVVSQGRGLVV